ncbi:fimbria/pilus outer membrane usher protein [Alkalinema sp. FACHB-956]|uniref:fimbria/pilus outer membrane usher protein n=1 Tax=Alkalinema sp. FACHB-956 TaxID=2692768 RepID=UPI0016860004|nr:fimbria/pilus outer membrane usher protein [Alkalinema sp. FACHB-956]MBD2326394.1 fimbrial biogenesis outer membrane usher protein [Alkalinema sp. FACHB-956]
MEWPLRCSPLLASIALPTAITVFIAASPTIVRAADQRAIFDLVVNLVKKQEIPIRLRSGDALVRLKDLQQAGISNLPKSQETLNGEDYVRLSALAPTIRYELDETATTLKLTVPPEQLATTVVSVANRDRPANLVYSKNTSLFLNYAVNAQDFQRFSFFGEMGLSFGNQLLYSSLNRGQNGKLVRGQTNLTIDNPGNMTRWVLGDHFANTDELGGSAFFAGISYGREFSLDPYFLRSPTLGLSGAALTPSTVDVYVNDALVKREELPPGPFRIKDLPVVSGSGAARLVLRDAFGREQQISYPYYYSAGLLAPGLSEFSYNLGFRRNNLNTESFDYGAPVFLARHRFGITNSLTAGLRLEASTGLLSGGANLAARLPFGEMGLAIAASQADGRSGSAAALSYAYSGKKFSLGFSARAMSPYYATMSLNPTDDRATFDFNAFTSVSVSRNVSLFGRYAYAHWRDQGPTTTIALGSTVRLNSQINLSISVNRNQRQDQDSSTDLYIGLNYSLGNGSTANLSHQRNGETQSTIAQIQKPIATYTGLGYRFQGQTGSQSTTSNAMFQYQAPFGRYELTHDRFNDQRSTNLRASGSIVAIGGKVMLSQPLTGSFALIDVPGLQGVQGLLNNQTVGTTNRNGSLLVPNLLPYYGNRLGITTEDIPNNYDVGGTEQVIAPPYRGGAVVRFAVEKAQAIMGTLVIDKGGQSEIPSYGQVTVGGQARSVVSPLGKQGEFYLENLAAGTYGAEVEYEGGVCRFSITVPQSKESFIKLGQLRCVMATQEAKRP